MYCRNCGAESHDRAVVCAKCGVLMGDGYNYCPNCGFQHDPKAVLCVECGHELRPFVKKGEAARIMSSNIKNENVYTLPEAVQSCWNKYANFSGRACRAEYWFWTLFQWIVMLFLTLLLVIAVSADDEYFGIMVSVLSVIICLILFLPSLAVLIRRLHDIGFSGWWCFMGLIPSCGSIVLLILAMCDSVNDNEYGTNPKSDKIKICG